MRPLLTPSPEANLVWVEETDSTNELASRIMARWVVEEVEEQLGDTVVVAVAQTAGRGRGQNVWQSPAGGLYATWLGWLGTESLTWLTMAAGVALSEAVEAAVPGLGIALKWPNDLMADGRKLAGILSESRISGKAAWAVVGFGVNVEVEPALPPGDPVRPVTLRTLGFTGTASDGAKILVGGFLDRLRTLLAGPSITRERWVSRSVHRLGDALRVRLTGEEIAGEFAGFGPDGHLLLTVGGARREISAGEIILPLAS